MTLLLVQTLNGLQLGVLLFLVAAGLTLVFGVLDVVNLAHGVQYMLGAYFAVLALRYTGSFWLALPAAALLSLAAGLLLHAAVFRHLMARSHLDQVLATYGLILFVEEAVRTVMGPAPQALALPALLSGTIPLPGGLLYPVYRIVLLATGLLAAAVLWATIERTRAGMLVRAAASNAPILSALGIDTGRLYAAVIGIGAYAVLATNAYAVLATNAPLSDLLCIAPIAMAAAALFAAITGLVALRTSGVTYIMITLAFGQMAYFVAQAWTPLGGDDGMALDARSTLLGTPALANNQTFYATTLAALILWTLLLRTLARSRYGRALRASAANPARTTALGYDVVRLRLAASAIAGAGGGLAGVFLANLSEFVSPAVLDWRASGHVLVMTILGSRAALAIAPQTSAPLTTATITTAVDAPLIGAAAAAITLIAAEEALALYVDHGALLLGPALILAALATRPR